ncbi:hypothetical protein EMCRGX_G027610 [Ephydatia muelleri]
MDGSEADVDVEIDDESTQQGEAQLSGGERQSQGAAGSSAGSGRGKRTLIGFAQRSILEEFYRSGMNSASMQFQHMHQAACDKTGLDLNVVKNWIRNRRRPTNPNEAHRTREHPPEAKRIRLDPLPIPSLGPQSTLVPQVSPSPGGPSGGPMLVKLRVADSGECDFVEVEVEHPSYHGLLRACCEELEVQPSDIVKIRKLPNIWPLTSVLTVNPFPSSNGLSLMTASCEPTVGSRPDLEHGNGSEMSCHPSASQQSH